MFDTCNSYDRYLKFQKLFIEEQYFERCFCYPFFSPYNAVHRLNIRPKFRMRIPRIMPWLWTFLNSCQRRTEGSRRVADPDIFLWLRIWFFFITYLYPFLSVLCFALWICSKIETVDPKSGFGSLSNFE